ncbi:leucine-rich repeat and IQ domain-containing protein 1-like [Mya arenaria]|uniref:leucine-rich repeat and IQ domain-containing protein 1-like n=1 Tax=Mya arenaria TaxID=6604 RepID=UPI0022E0218B|nr:leucine-rich repeat and IQ domain-containing protein 1-like [Mya arenaria]
MSMPPSGVEGVMDEAALIEAQIQMEQENIDLENDPANDLGNDPGEQDLDLELQEEVQIPAEVDDYIRRLQEQSNRFEQELAECDELLEESSSKLDNGNGAVILFDDQNLLTQLAKEHGLDPEAYRKKILEDIENDEDILDEDLADLINLDGENESSAVQADGILAVNIEKAVEEGVQDDEELPVSQALVPVGGGNKSALHGIEMQKMLREQLQSLEKRYEDRLDKMKKDEAFRRDEEEVRQKRSDEERHWKIQEIHQQEQQLHLEREMAAREIQKEVEQAEKAMKLEVDKFQAEIHELEKEVEKERAEYTVAMEMEEQRQTARQQKAILDIQRWFRGYRVRKEVKPLLLEKMEVRRQRREEERIQEVEVELEQWKNEENERKQALLKKQDEEKRLLEEERRKTEELKRQQVEEKKRLEEEKKRKKEEEERIKQEEKKRKEEEKQRKKEEEKRRKEEEKRRKEEEKRLKEEEERRKKEEEKARKDEEKRKKEEEKKAKEDEKRRKEEEKQRLEEEEKKRKEDERLRKEEEKKKELESKQKIQESLEVDKKESVEQEKVNKETEEHNTVETKDSNENHIKDIKSDKIHTEAEHHIQDNKDERLTSKPGPSSDMENPIIPSRPKTPKSSRTPRSHRTVTPRQTKLETTKADSNEAVKEPSRPVVVDSLPDHIEALRLRFMKDCLPWSKVSNEPWKLKGGISKKPLRRPSSAKKMPMLADDVIIQSARVASMKMVTTVELHDLPGSNMSPLGQCWGLKYLTLTRCHLVALEGLSQCKQLLYVNVRDNLLEYIDLKDVGQLQTLDVSHNKLTSIHGLDGCTNIRILNLAHNNITRIGGMNSLRRLHTLDVSYNQLISTDGLGATPTVQVLDMSHNHLQAVEDLEKLCLLVKLDATANNLQHVPSLENQVLLVELLLADNSISHLNNLAAVWLPLVRTVRVQQNSIEMLPSLQNCLVLQHLDVSNNLILDIGSIEKCVKDCFYLERLNLDENPAVPDIDERFYTKLRTTCPRLVPFSGDEGLKTSPVKPRTSMETMCFSQAHTLQDLLTHLHNSHVSEKLPEGTSISEHTCDIQYKLCERIFNLAVEYRYAHEYGDVSITMPTAPPGPKSGRPLSSRQREKFMNPKDMFENALKSSSATSKTADGQHEHSEAANGTNPKDLFENALKSNQQDTTAGNSLSVHQKVAVHQPPSVPSYGAYESKNLFEQALASACQPQKPSLMDTHSTSSLVNGYQNNGVDICERSAVRIQATWRGYWTRKILLDQWTNPFFGLDPELLAHLNKSAITIQARWRGYILRKKLMAALEFAQCDFGDSEDEDAMDLGDEFDLDKFVDIDEDLLDMDWKPPETPDIPNNYPVLKKPPSGKPHVPPLGDLGPPSNPRKAWRNFDSPLSEKGKFPRPPSSVASTELTMRSGVSKKEEKLSEEWGFKNTNTAHLMMQRAKKMKYNAERKKKIGKLDPKQRLALFRKLEEVTAPPTHNIPQRKTLPRKEYFQARQDEIVRQDREKRVEFHTRASRTFEWLHTQVGDHPTNDSVINQGFTEGPKYMPAEHNLPELLGGKRVQLVSSPMSMELQSLESASISSQKQRRFSFGSGSGSSKLPPIQPSSAPVAAVKERMTFRNPKVNQSVGWGGGRKRAK